MIGLNVNRTERFVFVISCLPQLRSLYVVPQGSILGSLAFIVNLKLLSTPNFICTLMICCFL